MKNQFFVSCLFVVIPAVFSHAATAPVPFIAKEPVQFTSVESDRFSEVGKPSDFIGVLTRENVQDPIQRHVDIYQFKKMPSLKLDKEKCTQIAESIVGPLNKISLQASPLDLKDSKAAGKICILILKDKDPQERMPERHLLVRTLNLKVFAFVFKHAKTPAESEIAGEIQFIDSLR